MSWNHRILAHKDGDEVYFQIHEVYYDEDGKPISYTTDGANVGSESLDGIKWVLNKNAPLVLFISTNVISLWF